MSWVCKCGQCKDAINPDCIDFRKYYDELSKITPNMWETLKESPIRNIWREQWDIIKKENMTKRERFLKAGGLFEKSKQTNKINVCNKDATVTLHFYNTLGKDITRLTNIEYIEITNAPITQDKDYPNQKAHFENILSNSKSDTWIASRNREIKIVDLNDKHLVNIMRYLVAHFEGIRDQFIENFNNWVSIENINPERQIGSVSRELKILIANAKGIKTPQYLSLIVVPFSNLIAEFNSRFGYDSLNSIYEGN